MTHKIGLYARSEEGVPRLGVWGMKSPNVPLSRSDQMKSSQGAKRYLTGLATWLFRFENSIKRNRLQAEALMLHLKAIVLLQAEAAYSTGTISSENCHCRPFSSTCQEYWRV